MVHNFVRSFITAMKKIPLIFLVLLVKSVSIYAQTDAYIKIHDSHERHPRVSSITFPGNVDNLAMYDAIYGHGAVIENPWVAYRIYMDNRQSLDLYVKQTPKLELDLTGFYTTPQQLEEGYGIDVLWAGKSIAAGSFRGWQNNQPVTIDTVAYRTQTVINDSKVEVEDEDWVFKGHPIQMKQIYSMLPDSRDLFVEIMLEGYTLEDVFATGVQKLETDNEGFIKPEGVAASWGSNIPDKSNPEIVEQVGLAIVVDPENIIEAKEDELNYLFLVKPDKTGKIRYKITAGGDREKNGYKNAKDWFDFVKNNNKLCNN